MAAESFQDALIECCKAIGGSKVVASLLWPAKAARDVETARRYLAACLDPDRAEKLSLDELMLILRKARDKGCHVGMEFLCAELSYAPPQPIAVEDARDELQRKFVASVAELARMAEQIQRTGSTN